MNECPKCGRDYLERHYYEPPEGGEFIAYIHETEKIGKGRYRVTETCDVTAGTGEETEP